MPGQRGGLPSWWTGPWRILPECPATGHNVLRRVEKPADGIKCICPRALALKAANLVMKREERKTVKRTGRTMIMPVLRPISVKEMWRIPSPDWTGAMCNTPAGRKASDRAYDAVSATKVSERIRAEMRAWCHICPIMQTCRAWALEMEKPAGSWGGVWGGLDPSERAAFVSRRAQLQDTGTGAADGTPRGDSSPVG